MLVGFVAFAVFMLVHIMGNSFRAVVNIGIPLLREKDAEPIAITGQVERIDIQTRNQVSYHFSYDGHTVYGTWLTINGENYFAVSTDSIAPGDVVTVEHLPESRVVLSLSQVETVQAD